MTQGMEHFLTQYSTAVTFAVISVELAYQLSSVVKLTHHGTGLDWPIPINPFLLLGGHGANGALCRASMGCVL